MNRDNCNKDQDVVITAYARSPFGRFWGGFREVPSYQLGAATVDALLAKSGLDAGRVLRLRGGYPPVSGCHVNEVSWLNRAGCGIRYGARMSLRTSP